MKMIVGDFQIKIKNILKPIYREFDQLVYLFLIKIFPSQIKDFKQVPIIINNRNRLTHLIHLIEWLERYGYNNLYIIDNDSAYPPLLDFYSKTKHTVFKLTKNMGYCALWETNIFKIFKKDFYVYTDPDILPINECPGDFMNYFFRMMQKYKYLKKIGFSLYLDDIPDHYRKKAEVIEWEKQYYTNKIADNLFQAPIDTTFALYRPWAKGNATKFMLTFRVGYPYHIRHMPWYENSDDLSDEEQYYISNSQTSTFWTNR
jgi:hypothetical protein